MKLLKYIVAGLPDVAFEKVYKIQAYVTCTLHCFVTGPSVFDAAAPKTLIDYECLLFLVLLNLKLPYERHEKTQENFRRAKTYNSKVADLRVVNLMRKTDV